MGPFNGLSNAQAERLAWLMEEMAEAQQAIGKILRHGYLSYNPTLPVEKQTTNRSDLERELADIEAAIDLLVTAGDLSATEVRKHRQAQSGRHRYMHHQPLAN